MFISKRFRKVIAAFLLLNMGSYILSPTLTLALTSGPKTPEVMSFEPIETSQMVNLNTGDLVYNLPLLEVPGPAGSYPLSLSYHAGINPSEEASWVGLGWNLNPGAIVRSVSGYPDDWKDVNTYQTESWVGGKTDRITAGLSASWWGVTLSGGIIYTQDTYKGTGWGGYTGASYGYSSDRFGVSAGLSASYDPVGGTSVGVNDAVGYKGERAAVGLSASSTFTMNGSSSGFGISGSAFGIGASISTYGGNTSVAIQGVGLKNSHLHKSGNITQSTSSNLSPLTDVILSLHSPLFNYKDERTKYHIDESQYDWVNGALYNNPTERESSFFDNRDYDVYDMFEVPDEQNPGLGISYPKFGVGNEIMLGGTLPAYDNYMVMGQGTGGSMRPYNFLNTLYRQNKKNQFDHYITKQYVGNIGQEPPKDERVEFMYNGEFSNKYLYDIEEENYWADPTASAPLSFSYDGIKIDSDPKAEAKLHNNKLARAANIEWFKNEEIGERSRANGLIMPKDFVRRGDLPHQIGAYMITNPSGVTYHYALPAYSYDEMYYTENIAVDQGKDGDYKTIVKRQEPYAYTWHLTAITGPDYVDRGERGLDEADWGYWVEFNYGKWASDYKWRYPGTGYIEDLDGNFRNFSSGKKELYYLNSIRTASHTALFVKDVRLDGKGLSRNDTTATFNPVKGNSRTPKCEMLPTSTLKLSKIILIQNKHLPAIDYSINNSYGSISGCGRYVKVHYGENVLLSENITESQRLKLKKNAQKTIVLETDYSLMPNTPNSFSNSGIYSSDPVTPTEFLGKLTLISISTRGKNGVSLLPPISFDYKNKNEPYCKNCIDYWGSYKHDYDPDIKDVNIKRMPTNESLRKTDSWSLNKIHTSLGAEINITYENDDYRQSVLHNAVNLPITGLEISSEGNGTYKVYMDELAGKLDEHFSIGDTVKSFIVIAEALQQHITFERLWPTNPITHTPIVIPGLGGCASVDYFKLNDVKDYQNKAEITAIGSNYLTLDVIGNKPVISHQVPYYYKSPTGVVTPDEVVVIATDANPDQNAIAQCVPFRTYKEFFKDFIGGEIIAEIKDGKIGGGLRVNEIAVTDNFTGTTTSTCYDYTDPVTGESSGVTTYIPFKMNKFLIEYPEHYKNALEGYFRGDERLTGVFINIIKNYREFFRTVLLGPTIERLAESWNILTYPDRDDIEGFINAGLTTENSFIEYKRSSLMGDLLAKINEVPSAGITYQFVTVKSKTTNNGRTTESDSYLINEFVTYDPSMVTINSSHSKVINSDLSSGSFRNVVTRGITINNFGSAVGQPKSVQTWNNNGQKLSERKFNYLHEVNNNTSDYLNNYLSKLERFDHQGVIDEVSVNARYVPYDLEYVDVKDENGDKIETDFYRHDLLGIVTKRRTFPVVTVSVEDINYKTGVVTSSQNMAFDFYSGSTLKTLTSDSYGNYYINESVPAYLQYPEMGPKGYSVENKNMLTQAAATYSFKVNPENYNDKLGLVKASVQTWSNQVKVLKVGSQPGIWRKHASWFWDGQEDLNNDGTFKLGEFEANAFDFANPGNNAFWERSGEITLYNVYSHGLEAKDINGNFTATRMDPEQFRVIASATNANYYEMAYSGAEYYSKTNSTEGGVNTGDGIPSRARSHTGAVSLQVPASGTGFIYTLNKTNNPDVDVNKKYKANVWVYVTGDGETPEQIGGVQLYCKVDGEIREVHPILHKNKSKNWYRLELIADLNGGNEVEFGCRNLTGRTVYFDDFRVVPLDGSMNTYVYDPNTDELNYILNDNNFYTKYEYDAMGRLIRTRQELLNYDFGDGKESFRPDRILSEHIIKNGRTVKDILKALDNIEISIDPYVTNLNRPTNFVADNVDEKSGPFTYTWDFGDEATGNGQVVNHTYSASGSFKVVLEVAKEGTKYNIKKEKYLEVGGPCPLKGTVSAVYVCETNQSGCNTGYKLIRVADGNCGWTEDRILDKTACPQVDGAGCLVNPAN